MGKKVLVIEDNELNMKLVRSLLKLGEFEVAEAETAEKGIQLARDCHPDLMLMDIQLPGMDGLEATRKIKKDGSLNGIPIVALTSYAMQGDEEKALAAGCVGYITKPIDTKVFLKTIKKYLA
jgi:CheY-like chemotaxis protein